MDLCRQFTIFFILDCRKVNLTTQWVITPVDIPLAHFVIGSFICQKFKYATKIIVIFNFFQTIPSFYFSSDSSMNQRQKLLLLLMFWYKEN